MEYEKEEEEEEEERREKEGKKGEEEIPGMVEGEMDPLVLAVQFEFFDLAVVVDSLSSPLSPLSLFSSLSPSLSPLPPFLPSSFSLHSPSLHLSLSLLFLNLFMLALLFSILPLHLVFSLLIKVYYCRKWKRKELAWATSKSLYVREEES